MVCVLKLEPLQAPNPFQYKCSVLLGGRVPASDPSRPSDASFRLARAWFSLWFHSFILPLLHLRCCCPVDPQTSSLPGETLKPPLKLYCNHTPLKETRKCLPHASKPCVCALVSCRGLLTRVRVVELSGADQICQSHSAVCLPGVWQVFDAAQALERIKPFLNWLYLPAHATGALWTHQKLLLLWSNELFLAKKYVQSIESSEGTE